MTFEERAPNNCWVCRRSYEEIKQSLTTRERAEFFFEDWIKYDSKDHVYFMCPICSFLIAGALEEWKDLIINFTYGEY